MTTRNNAKTEDITENKEVTNKEEDKVKSPETLSEKLKTGIFDETDADDDPMERGWIIARTTENGVTTVHKVPVQYWDRYSRIHNL